MPTILFVEDEQSIGSGTKEYLEEFKDDYQVTWFDRGDTAYDRLLQPGHTFDCIILNLTLSCLAAIQAPIILMSRNRESERDRIKSERDFLINRKAEKEIKNIQVDLQKLLRRK